MNFNPQLLAFFEQHQLPFEYHEHPPIFTVAEGEALKQTLPGKQTKNLFLTDKRGQYYLVCIESSKRLQINQFRKLIGAKDMTFATPEEMKEILNLTPGSVSVFGLVYATSCRQQATSENIQAAQGNLQLEDGNLQPILYIDAELWASDLIGRHPNRNDATIIITHETLVQFLKVVGIEAQVIEVGN